MSVLKTLVGHLTLTIFVVVFIIFLFSFKVFAENIGTTTLVSVADDGSLPDNVSASSEISSDGRFVYFSSYASNLVPNDTNGSYDVFVRDRTLGTTTRLSVDSSGNQSSIGINGGSFDVSDDGRYIVFESSFGNQGEGIYIRDSQSNTTNLLFHNYVIGQSAENPKISGDGNYVVFQTQQPLPPFSDDSFNIYILNRSTLQVSRISNKLDGTAAGGVQADINYDGSKVVFTAGPGLVVNDTNGKGDVFLWDRNMNNISRVSISSNGMQANDYSQFPHISNDGNKVVFESYSTNLTSNATAPLQKKVFLRDLITNTTTLMSVTPEDNEGNGDSDLPNISGDGKWVSFDSGASNLVVNDTDNMEDAFVRSTQNNTTELVSLDLDGNSFAFGGGGNTALNYDGRFVTFGASIPGIGTGIYLRDLNQPDITPPIVTGIPDRPPNANGWYNTDVNIDWQSTDPAPSSGIPTDPPDTLANLEGTNTYTSAQSCDPAGNCATGSLTLSIDKTAPTINYSISPAPNSSGWNNSNVTVSFVCSDATSGIATCPPPITVTQEGAGQIIEGMATDKAGNSASAAVMINIDKTVPVVSNLSWSANPLQQGQNTTLSATVADALSGVASVAYSIDGGTAQAMSYDQASGTWKAAFGTALAANTYNVVVTAVDAAGNASSSNDILAVYNAANGYVIGHARQLPTATDSLPIALDTSNKPAQLIAGFSNVTSPSSGSFDIDYSIKNKQNEFSISSTSINWVVVADSTHASILGRGDLTTWVNGVQTVTQNVAVRFDIVLGINGNPDQLSIKIYNPNLNPSTDQPTYTINDNVIVNGSNLMVHM